MEMNEREKDCQDSIQLETFQKIGSTGQSISGLYFQKEWQFAVSLIHYFLSRQLSSFLFIPSNYSYYVHAFQMPNTHIIYIRQSMHKPLSLFPRKHTDNDVTSSSPSIQKCTDSLALSISEDKQESNKSSFLEERHQSVSKQLESLQIKLQDLQSQIMPITMETCKVNSRNQTIRYQNKFDHNSTAEFFKRKKMQSEGQENSMQKANAGKIVSKRQDKIGKSGLKRDISTHHTNYTKNSLITESSQMTQKSKEVSRLKKQVEIMRTSLQKSQRSMSHCSERLSASKSIIQSMKAQQKKYLTRLEQLKCDLKKSQNIRQKQKRVILTQRRELQKCRQMLRKVHK